MAKSRSTVPPNAIPSEGIVLGCMLESADSVDRALEILKPEHFYRATHGIIFEAMLKLNAKGHPVDIVTVQEATEDSSEVEPAYLLELQESIVSPAHAEHHARLVLRAWQFRRAREIAMVLQDRTSLASIEDRPEEIIADAENALFEVLNSQTIGGPKLIGPVMNDELIKAGDLPKDGMTGLPTGIQTLDRLTGGWQNSEMVILAGRPSQGKTNVGLFFARTLAFKNNIPVQFFSLEMGLPHIAQRVLCSMAKVDSNKFRRGDFTPEEARLLNEWSRRSIEMPLFIDDTVNLTLTALKARAKRSVSAGVRFIVIDYLGLVVPEDAKGNKSTYQLTTEISRRLKSMAKELDVPLLILCQLNRKSADREDNKPKMSDLRDSGSIEQDADMILLIHRAGLYDKKIPRSKMELILEKQRCGPTGTINLFFEETTGHITEEDRHHDEGAPY